MTDLFENIADEEINAATWKNCIDERLKACIALSSKTMTVNMAVYSAAALEYAKSILPKSKSKRVIFVLRSPPKARKWRAGEILS